MLILAGVSISLVVGENGVLTQAQSANEKTTEGSMRDAISLGNANFYAGYYEQSASAKETYNLPSKMAEMIKANYENGTTNVSIKTDTDPAKTADADIISAMAYSDTDKVSSVNVIVTVGTKEFKATLSAKGKLTDDNKLPDGAILSLKLKD